jgi:hypothetical protein
MATRGSVSISQGSVGATVILATSHRTAGLDQLVVQLAAAGTLQIQDTLGNPLSGVYTGTTPNFNICLDPPGIITSPVYSVVVSVSSGTPTAGDVFNSNYTVTSWTAGTTTIVYYISGPGGSANVVTVGSTMTGSNSVCVVVSEPVLVPVGICIVTTGTGCLAAGYAGWWFEE